MKIFNKIGAIACVLLTISAYGVVDTKVDPGFVDPLEGGQMGAAGGAATAAAIHYPIAHGMGLGALLGYLVALKYSEQPMEYFFKDNNVVVMDDVTGIRVILPTDLMLRRPNGDYIDEHYYPVLNKVIDLLNSHPNIHIDISGHTDDVLRDNDREAYSLQHAKTVADYFLSRGVPAARINAVRGFGDREAMASNRTIYTRYVNRRVEVTLLRDS